MVAIRQKGHSGCPPVDGCRLGLREPVEEEALEPVAIFRPLLAPTGPLDNPAPAKPAPPPPTWRRGWGREGRREGVDTLTAGSGRLNVVEPDRVAVLARGHHMSKMNISLSSLGSNRGAVSSGNSKWKHSGQQQIGAFAVSTSRRCSFGMSCGQLSLFNITTTSLKKYHRVNGFPNFIGLFVWAGLAYKPWLKVLLTGLV